MKKALVRISTACGLALLLFASPGAHAFCTEFDVVGVGVNCVDEGHKLVTSASLQPIMRHEIYLAIWSGNWINLLGLTGSTPLSPEDLFDRNLGEWTLFDWLAPVRADMY